MVDKRDDALPLISESAPAKINLYLHIIGPRQGGYHVINSFVVFTNITDALTVTPAKDFKLDVSGLFGNMVGANKDNLALKAAVSLREALDIDDGAHIRLVKNIPVGAGLGGGSSDAAATLRALIRLWGIRPRDERVIAVAEELGADVPACFWQVSGIVSGIGQDIKPASALPALDLVLVNPGVELLTKDVYDTFEGSHIQEGDRVLPDDSFSNVNELVQSLRQCRNDLTEMASKLAPQIQRVLIYLRSLPGSLLVRMTGSGPTCFAVFADFDAASRAASYCQIHEPNWWVKQARVGGRQKYSLA